MNENLPVFLIWAACGLPVAGIGIADCFRKTPAGFFANAEPPAVSDVRRYNRAVGLLLIAFGLWIILLGLPLLFPAHVLWILLSIPLLMLGVIAMMAVYQLYIGRKYIVKE